MLSGVELSLLEIVSPLCREAAMRVPRFYTGLRGLPSGRVVAEALIERGVVEWGACVSVVASKVRLSKAQQAWV